MSDLDIYPGFRHVWYSAVAIAMVFSMYSSFKSRIYSYYTVSYYACLFLAPTVAILYCVSSDNYFMCFNCNQLSNY